MPAFILRQLHSGRGSLHVMMISWINRNGRSLHGSNADRVLLPAAGAHLEVVDDALDARNLTLQLCEKRVIATRMPQRQLYELAFSRTRETR